MLLEELLLLISIATGIYFIIIPTGQLISAIVKKKTDPVKEAKIRLATAEQELEVAKINRKIDEIYKEEHKEEYQEIHDLLEKAKLK